MSGIEQHVAKSKKFKVLSVSDDDKLPDISSIVGRQIWLADNSVELSIRLAVEYHQSSIMLIPTANKQQIISDAVEYDNIKIITLPLPKQNIEPPYETNPAGKIAWFMGVEYGRSGDTIVRL